LKYNQTSKTQKDKIIFTEIEPIVTYESEPREVTNSLNKKAYTTEAGEDLPEASLASTTARVNHQEQKLTAAPDRPSPGPS
jgi:hypothetical protein